MDDNATDWPDILAAYFGIKLTEREYLLYWTELTTLPEGIRGLTNEELCKAIRAASNSERSKYRPDLKQLRIWVFTYRKAQRESWALSDSSRCTHCRKGWLDVYPELPGDASEADRAPYVPRCVPCLCESGERILQTAQDYKGASPSAMERLEQLRRLAMTQTTHIEP